jgi:hypothetical protein
MACTRAATVALAVLSLSLGCSSGGPADLPGSGGAGVDRGSGTDLGRGIDHDPATDKGGANDDRAGTDVLLPADDAGPAPAPSVCMPDECFSGYRCSSFSAGTLGVCMKMCPVPRGGTISDFGCPRTEKCVTFDHGFAFCGILCSSRTTCPSVAGLYAECMPLTDSLGVCEWLYAGPRPVADAG